MNRDILLERGFANLYTTCSPRVIPVYTQVGGKVLETRDFDSDTRYFFQIALNAARRR